MDFSPARNLFQNSRRSLGTEIPAKFLRTFAAMLRELRLQITREQNRFHAGRYVLHGTGIEIAKDAT
jgi:hypothetical protein